jgi:hypothetical protein
MEFPAKTTVCSEAWGAGCLQMAHLILVAATVRQNALQGL